jgi:undecaprenyl-diphosphatase
MNEWEAVILGVVEGLTEYLPVSSTGHLILTQRLLGIPEDAASVAYAICIQSGAILAVLGLYWERMLQMVRGVVGLLAGRATPDSQQGLRLAVNIVVAFLPAAVVALLLDDWIERVLFGLWYTVAAWFAGGVAILLVARYQRRRARDAGRPLEQLDWRSATAIGVMQCLAMWPGTSRSLITIVVGLAVGLSLPAAVEFSFLLGVVTLLAATVYKIKDAGPVMLAEYGWTVMLIGAVAAWFSAVLAVKWMVTYLKRHGMELFGYYRLALACVVALLLSRGWL